MANAKRSDVIKNISAIIALAKRGFSTVDARRCLLDMGWKVSQDYVTSIFRAWDRTEHSDDPEKVREMYHSRKQKVVEAKPAEQPKESSDCSSEPPTPPGLDPNTPVPQMTAGQLRDLILWQRYQQLKKYFNQ